MRENLEITNGLILSEAVMMALAPFLSRLGAKKIVGQACEIALKKNKHLRDILAAMPDVSKHLSKEELDVLFNPKNYLGLAGKIIDEALKKAK
jgi:3-carboxy-cis,cis-muconate cycloisomerase